MVRERDFLVYLSVRLRDHSAVAIGRNLPAFKWRNELDKVQGVVINPFDEHPELVDWAYFEDDSK